MRMRSLLNKTLAQYIGCTAILLLLTAPLFYWLTKQYYAEDLADVMEHIRLGIPLPDLDLEEDIVKGVMIQFVMIFSVLSLSLLVTMRFITKKLWKPFDTTLTKIEHFNLEHSKVPNFSSTDIKEFARLNIATQELMSRDKQSYIVQKEFTENASHELQTPIAVFQSKLDLLLQEELTEKQAEIVNELYAVSSRLSRLNKDLLLLAKIDNDQLGEQTRVNAIYAIGKNIALYKELYHKHRVEVISQSSNPLYLNVNVLLFDSLINNLIVNAIRNSPDGSKIEIEIDDNEMTVSNPASGKKLDEKSLFQRFNTSSQGDNKRGNGLGLAIVKAICDYHNWKIEYQFEHNRHVFRIKFS